jgi:hypothetical protein
MSPSRAAQHFDGEEIDSGQYRQMRLNVSFHVVLWLRSGAGAMPCRFSTLPIVRTDI